MNAKIFLITSLIFLICFYSCASTEKGTEIPEFFGTYLVEKGKLIKLKKEDVVIKHASAECSKYEFISGLENLSDLNVKDNKCHIIFYEHGAEVSNIKLTKLRFECVSLLDCISLTFKTKKVKSKLNLWIKEKNIPYKISPVESRNEMYRLVPDNPLEPGAYAIHTGCFWQQKSDIFGMRMVAQNYGTSAYVFSVNLGDYVPTEFSSSTTRVSSTTFVSEQDFPSVEGKSALELFAIGRTFHEKGYPSVQYFKKASQIEAKWSKPYYFLGLIYFEDEENYVKAEECLNKCSRINLT
ncbi:MAG: hypothetical protein R6U40_06345 [Desulfobacterales bacterium]